MERYTDNPHIGRLIVPSAGNHPSVLNGCQWAADNGAFSGFNADLFTRMLDRFYELPNCLFVTAPDVVADAKSTNELFRHWGPFLSEQGWPVAYVAQDGCIADTVPWEQIRCLFIGGSTEYKLSAAPLISEAKQRDKWVHIGRVNSLRRLRWAFNTGADSIDGSSFSRFPDTYIPWALRYIEGLHKTGRQELILI